MGGSGVISRQTNQGSALSAGECEQTPRDAATGVAHEPGAGYRRTESHRHHSLSSVRPATLSQQDTPLPEPVQSEPEQKGLPGPHVTIERSSGPVVLDARQ